MMRESCVLVAVLVLFLLFSTSGAGEYLVVLRGKSKHTSLIAPLDGWDIPVNELKSCFGDQFEEFYSLHRDPLPIGNGGTFRRLARKGFSTHEKPCTDESVSHLERLLISASTKCVLIHGLFEIWSEGYGVDVVVSRGEKSHQYLSLVKRLEEVQQHCDTFRPMKVHVAASVLEQPWLTSLQLKDSFLTKFEHMWECFGGTYSKGTSDQVYLSEKLESQRVAVHSSLSLTPVEELHMRVFVDEISGYCVLCRMLSRGLAAPSNSGGYLRISSRHQRITVLTSRI